MKSPTRKHLAGALTILALAGISVPVVASSSQAPSTVTPRAALRAPVPLEHPALVAVYSATDKDAQLFVSTGAGISSGRKHPIERIALRDPKGRRVVAGRFSDRRGLGISDLRVDTPEPSLAKLKKAYPPGSYRWSGRSIDGRKLRGTAKLNYKLLAAPVINHPTPGQHGLRTSGLVIDWNRVPGAVTIHLEIEDAKLPHVLTVDLPGDATTFVVPDGFLQSNRTYVIDVKAVAGNGNLTVSDLAVRTG